jgi:ribosomal protein L11 methyltransferase
VDWQQLELELPAAQLPQAEALLGLLGARSLTLLGAGDDEILEPEPETTPVWNRTRVRALFDAEFDLAGITAVLKQHLGARLTVNITSLPQSAWLDAAQAVPKVIEIGRQLSIVPADTEPPTGPRTIVRLYRGPGFGTGEHPTTRLCLQWLDAELVAGARVIDFGCGSGILAVAALCLGAAYAWAVDVEPQAVDATRANARLNGVADRLWAGAPAALATPPADLLLANILARPLIELAPQLAALIDADGTLVLSGILTSQRDKVAAVYARRFAAVDFVELDGWVSLIATRRYA